MRWLPLVALMFACSDNEDITRHPHDLASSGFDYDMNSLVHGGDHGDREGGIDGDSDSDGGSGSTLDPALCPMGVADGCCPLLRYGGSDPDCKPLTCALQPSAPIALEDHGRVVDSRSQVAMAWNGRELALVRVDPVFVNNMSAPELVFERRDFAGNLTFGPQRTTITDLATGRSALAWDPQSKSYLFLDGQLLWNDNFSYEVCNGIDAIGDVFVQGGRFIVAGDQFTCAGSTSQPILVEYSAAGKKGTSTLIGDGLHPELSWHGAEGCDLDCKHLLSIWDRSTEGSLRARVLDTASEKIGDGVDFDRVTQAYIDHSGVTSDGDVFFVYYAVQTASGGTTQIFRRVRLGSGFIDSGFSTAGPRALPPSVIWTGSGYLVAAATFTLTTSQAFPNDNRSYTIQLWQFDADGKLVASWQNESDAGYQPELAWAGGRIALSWVRVSATDVEQRFLRYLDCP